MYAPFFSKRQMRAANGAHADRAAGLAVDAKWSGKSFSAISGSNVKHIAVLRVAVQVDQVDDFLLVDQNLRLNAAIGDAHECDTWQRGRGNRPLDRRSKEQS